VVVLLSLVLLRWPRTWVTGRFSTRTRTVTILLRRGSPPDEIVAAIGSIPGVVVRSLTTRQRDEGMVVEAQLRRLAGTDIEDVVGPLAAREDVAEFEVS
jgi:hypothetical protein